MIDSQLAAQVLFNHQLASQEQILACWPHITSEKDVGMLLVEQGIISGQTYQELAAYLRSQSPAPESQVSANGSQAAASPGGELALEPAPPGLSEIAVPERDGSVLELEEENWSPALDPDEPQIRKTSRAEHLQKKASPPAPGPAAPQSMPSPSADISANGAEVSVPAALGPDATWEELLAFSRQHDAADLHLSAGNPILLRRYGSLQAATDTAMEQTSLRKWVERALTPEQMQRFEEKGDLELIYTLPGWGRYRVTLIKQRRGWDVTARVIPSRIRSFEEAGLPESCRDLTKWAQGLVLVTGPVGCGKTSTLSTLVEMVNQERHDHIITIEEPIEILYEPAHCRITQRQIGPHTLTRDAALRAALREDPDIIVISELRDLDTIRLAVSAAETGHLVFGTMNTTNAARTLYRLVDSFPPEEQGIIRNMISESLRGVISQQLVPRKDGAGMQPAFEVLLVNTAVANMIRKDEAHQLGTAMLTGKSSGMVLLDDSLRTLVEKGIVDPAEAMMRATVPKDFEKYGGRR
jgi:twitching motility protein PilT